MIYSKKYREKKVFNQSLESWIVQNGRVKVRANTNVCMMWNLQYKTRMWALPCGEQIFAPLE